MRTTAAALLLLGLLRHYAWELAPVQAQAQVWNIFGSITIATALLLVASRETALIVIWWLAEEAQVVLCGLWWIHRPWEVKPGEAQCSSLLGGFDLSTLGLLAVASILAVKSYRYKKKGNPS